MSSPSSAPIILRADPEHSGVRMGTLLAIIVGLLVGYVVVRIVLGRLAQDSLLLEFATVISCAGAVPIALALGYIVEQYLKRSWSSGQEIELSGREMRFSGRSPENGAPFTRVLDFDKRVNLTRWYFELQGYPKAGRERLVRGNWLCLACQMQQDGERIITFAYMPPGEAGAWIENESLQEPFHRISLAKLYEESGKRRSNAATRPEVSSALLAGPDGRYWIAERRRWTEGAELTVEDFATLMAFSEEKTLAEKAQPPEDGRA